MSDPGSDDAAIPGGKLEYAVLVALWEGGALSGREIHDRVGTPLKLVYTTTAKVLDRLVGKGLVARERRGRVFVFSARTERAPIEERRVRRTLSGLFGGELRPAMAALVDAMEAIDPALLDDLATALATRRRGRSDDGEGGDGDRGGDLGNRGGDLGS